MNLDTPNKHPWAVAGYNQGSQAIDRCTSQYKYFF